MSFRDLMKADDLRPFAPVEPPFNFNAPHIAAHPPEVTGGYILHAALQRLGWASFAGKTVLDFGCGVRLARAIYNLNMPFGLYVGVDVNRDAITWLEANLSGAQFRFAHLNAQNPMYNAAGEELGDDALERLALPLCDLAMMFSVITHQDPTEAALTFRQARRVVATGGKLYFTAFIDETIADYVEATPEKPRLHSTFHPAVLIQLLEQSGWRVDGIYPQKNTLQAPVFVCTAED